MERVRFIEHQGKRVVLLDFSGLKDIPVGLVEIAKAKQFFATQLPPDKSALTLTDVSETVYDKTIIDAMKDLTAHNRPFVKAAAVVSQSAIHRAAVSVVALFSRRKLETFDTREAALAWLVSQA